MASNHSGPQGPASDEAELRYLIERLLVRATLVPEGQDERLDALLSELRQYLRGQVRDPASLRGFLERLDDELARLDDQVAGEAREAGRILSGLLASVEHSDRLHDTSSELKRLRRELGPQGLPRQQLLPWLESFSRVAQRALSGEGAEPGRERGLFDRIFHRRDNRQAVTDEDVTSERPQPEPELDLAMRDAATDEPPDNEQRLRIARRVGELMDRVIQQVELPPDTHKRALLLKSRLSDEQDWSLLRQSLDETADLIIAMVTHSQREFESFLERLDERLSSLHGHFSDHAESMAGRRTSAAEMEETVQAELSELDGSLRNTSDLAQLRTSVSRHIERIAGTVEAFRHQEDEREQQLTGQMEAMREKLVAVETHSEQIRKQLEQERARALTDILTQLPNREAWDERLRFEHDRWQRYGRPVALVVIDIDHFKAVNDSFGHKAGDRVIQLVARALQERLRATDFVARYGGEEFVAVLPETTLDQAVGVVDELRLHVADMPFHFQGKPVRVSVSAGLSCFRDDIDPDMVFDEADKALYTAKKNGRNRVEMAMELKTQ